MDQSDIERVRRFNRTVTRRIGAVDDSYLGRGRPLGQARLLFEIGPGGAEIRELRERLGLDSGYASRLLKALETQGLVTVAGDAGDRRRRIATLTPAGIAEHQAYDALSDGFARSLLGRFDPARRNRLLAAMEEVATLLTAASVQIDLEPPGSEAARVCIAAYVAELGQRFEEGFDPGKGNPTPDAAELVPPNGCFLLARLDGRPIGCAVLRRLGPGIGEIKRMWVAPNSRGLGVAGRLLSEIEAKARALGFARVCLDTNRALVEAQAMYRKAGYRETAPYNDNPYADHWFEKELAPAG